jgi:hypothetical protein
MRTDPVLETFHELLDEPAVLVQRRFVVRKDRLFVAGQAQALLIHIPRSIAVEDVGISATGVYDIGWQGYIADITHIVPGCVETHDSLDPQTLLSHLHWAPTSSKRYIIL